VTKTAICPKIRKAALFLWLFVGIACKGQAQLLSGAEQTQVWKPLLQGKTVGLVVNHTAYTPQGHILDALLREKQSVKAVFAPEHGFRGEAEAGAKIENGKDPRTGTPVISLYGSKKKPQPADLKGIDLLIFDMQDVGARFYTYISTLHYVMEACAEQNIPLLLLDRPNPNGHYIDGPILDTAFRSFVGMHPIPIVHGMTLGEYAQMINGEGWLAGGVKCQLQIVKLKGYTRQTAYALPIPPSPNLPDMHSVYLYPSTCFFEGTDISLGRGTDRPFQLVGAPWFKGGDTSFIPRSIPGKAEKPPQMGVLCHGFDYGKQPVANLRQLARIDLAPLLTFYAQAPDKTKFFTPFFDKLAGGDVLRKQIAAGMTEADIRKSWEPGLKAFAEMRKKYLLYP
jgi:uncharacterized protein YbbC (DUF1343 family)